MDSSRASRALTSRQPRRAAGLAGLAWMAWMAGFAQFSATVLIGEVAAELSVAGAQTAGHTAVGLSGTALGVAFAVIRLASVGGLAVGVLADRFGRRPVLIAAVAGGLALTGLSALASGFVWWVVLIAAARPGLTAAESLVGVVAAEGSAQAGRTWAVVWVLATFAIGAGSIALLHGLGVFPSFRPLLATSGVLLVLVPLVARTVREPAVYRHDVAQQTAGVPARLGSVPGPFRPRLVAACALTGVLGMTTAPVLSHVFVYGEHVLARPAGDVAWLVMAGGVTGGAGLLAGRWAADTLGRRTALAASLPILGVAAWTAFGGSFVALSVGYLGALFASAAFGPAWGAWQAEAFPTTSRATAAGWASVSGILGAVAGLLGFGALIDLFGGFGLAILPFAATAVLGSAAALGLPETNDQQTLLPSSRT